MKQKKSMILLAALLLILIAVYEIMSVSSRKREEQEAKKEEEETIYLVQGEEITGLKYTDGETTMSFQRDEDTWYYEEDQDIPLQQSSIETMAETVEGLTAVRELEGPDALEDYGLESPSYTVWYTQDEETTALYIGNTSGENYYLTVGDEGKVYTITSSLISGLSFELDDLVEHDAVPYISAEELEKVEIVQKGESVQYEEEEQLESFADGIGELTFDDCVNYHAQEEELAAYGLEDSNRIAVTATYQDSTEEEEQTFTIYIGGEDENGEYRYVMADGSDMVYQISVDTAEKLMISGS